MTLSNAATCMFVAFIVGAYAGYRYAIDGGPAQTASAPATVAMASPLVAQADMRTDARSVLTPTGAAATSGGVAGPLVGPDATAGPVAPASGRDAETGTMDPELKAAILKMAERSGALATTDFAAQMRSEPWADEREAKIRAAVDPQLSAVAGARLLRAECRTTLCQTEVIAPEWARELTAYEREPGTLHHAIAAAGFDIEIISNTDYTEPGMKRLVFTMRPTDAAASRLANGH